MLGPWSIFLNKVAQVRVERDGHNMLWLTVVSASWEYTIKVWNLMNCKIRLTLLLFNLAFGDFITEHLSEGSIGDNDVIVHLLQILLKSGELDGCFDALLLPGG